MNWGARLKKGITFAIVLVLVFMLSSFTSLLAATATTTGQFEIHATVSGDALAPTIPTGLSATAVSDSQIDLSWTASTDNVAVTGYKIYRDSVFLTTVGGTTYSDIALAASTLYSYTVSAIDGSGNESAQSAPASATTFPAPIVTPPVQSGGGTSPSSSGLLYDLVVTPTSSGAIITWKTSSPSESTLSWGATANYELGTSPESVYSVSHSVTVNGLNSGTQYYFGITDLSGEGATDFYAGTFTTLPIVVGLANPSHFTAVPEVSDILLSWNNPDNSSFSNVRIVRSATYFPSAPDDGDVIYEGAGKSFKDENVSVDTRYYYAIFAKYADGSYSSGALATAEIVKPGEVATPYNPFDTLPLATGVAPQIAALTFADFDFIQKGVKLDTVNGTHVAVNGTEDLTVSLDYDKVPEVLKSIIVTLSFPEHPEETFSFLLRVNADKTRYSATIGPLGVSGIYGIQISIVDFKDRGLKKILGNLYASAVLGFESEKGIFPGILSVVTDNWFDILLLLIIIFVIAKALHATAKRDRVAKFESGT